MKYIVSINHNDFLISDEAKAMAIVKAMMGAVEVRDREPWNGSNLVLTGSVSTKLQPVHPKAKLFVRDEETESEKEVTEAPAPKPRRQIGKPQLLLGS